MRYKEGKRFLTVTAVFKSRTKRLEKSRNNCAGYTTCTGTSRFATAPIRLNNDIDEVARINTR
jgi:hypothetical protein